MTAYVVLSLTAVLVLGLSGYVVWRLGVAEQESLTDRTASDAGEPAGGRRIVRLDRRVRRTSVGRSLGRRLERAGLGWRVADVAAGLAVIAAVAFVLATALMAWWVALVVACLAVWLSLKVLDRRENQRREAFIAQLPEIARVLSNATAAGLALRSAIRMAADDMADPAGGELRYLSGELDIGTSMSDAMAGLHDRLPSRELSLLTRTLVIQARAGGAVVAALQEMSQTLEARKDIRREVRTILAGSVFTSWVVLILGVGSLVMMNLIAPGTLNRMTHTLVGQATLGVAAILYVLGFVLIRRTTRIEV